MLKKSNFSQQLMLIVSAILLLAFVGILSTTYAQEIRETKEIRFPRLDIKVDPNEAYLDELLHLILKNTKHHYSLTPTHGRMQQERSIYEMTKSDGLVDLMWTMTTDEREKKLIPIRLPIDKGLIGWRIALITAKNRHAFATIRSIEDLRVYLAGQERDWPDVGILRANQLPVTTSNAYEPLFKMLIAGRFDYFPRSIFEVYSDIENHKEHALEADQNIVIYYPSAYYFFVSPHRPKLAEDLQIGFEKIIANGSFEKLFQKHNQASIDKANIKQRIIIRLKNPSLNANSMPLHRPELWFQP